MKKFFLFALVATVFAACSTDATQDLAPEIPTAPDELHVSFDAENTRIQLGDNGSPVWTEGDLVSVFYRSNAHDKYEFTGETGDTGGTLKRVSQSTPTMGLDKVIAVYPYNENHLLSPLSGNIKASLPAEQTYLADSYGIGSSIMVSSSQTDRIYMKNVCGWLKLQFTGEGPIEKIVLRGNNGEQVAGDIYIYSDDASCTLASELTGADGTNSGDLEGALVGTNTILTEVTLNCDGVALNSETPTAFYIALPPQTFENGITTIAYNTDGNKKEISTKNTITIERSHILPMASIEIEIQSNNEIWYTSKDGKIVEPYLDDEFGGATLLSNTYEEGKGIIKFNGNVTSIGYGAFALCSALESVTIPNSVTSIGDDAFYYCSALKSVHISDSVTSIGDYAFNHCSALKSITIPDSVTEIGAGAFWYCDTLKSVTIGNSVTSIEGSAFSGCSALECFYGKFASEDNRCLIIDGVLKALASAGLTSYTIPNSVTSIGARIFDYCSALTSITIPDSVTSIGEYAFWSCKTLKSVTIGNSVISIGEWAFDNCSALESVTIGNSVTSIGERAFSSCSALESITIPNSVTSIGNYAFAFCSALKSVTIGNSVTSIGNTAFYYCSALESVTIGNSVTSIGKSAFAFCSALTSVTIPNSVTEIRYYAFLNCTALKDVYCKPTTPPTGDFDMFDNNTSGRRIYVPTASVDAYKGASYWKNYADYIEPYNFTE